MEIFLNLVRENIYTTDVCATFCSLLLFAADHQKKDMEIIFLLKYPVNYCRSSSLDTTDSQSQAFFRNSQKCWKLPIFAKQWNTTFGSHFLKDCHLKTWLAWKKSQMMLRHPNFQNMKVAHWYYKSPMSYNCPKIAHPWFRQKSRNIST